MAQAPFISFPPVTINLGGGGAAGGGVAPPAAGGGALASPAGGGRGSAELKAMQVALAAMNRELVKWSIATKKGTMDQEAMSGALNGVIASLQAYHAAGKKYVGTEMQIATAARRARKELEARAVAGLKGKIGPLARATEAYRIKGVHDPQLYKQLETAIGAATTAREKLIGTGVKHTATEKQAATAISRGTKELGRYKTEADEAGSALGGLAKRMQRIALWAIGWNLMYSAINKVREALAATAQRAMDMENVIARVGMVIKVSNEAIREQVDLLSKRYGRSVTEVGQAMEAFARQGIGFANAVEMSNLALQGSLALGDPVSQMVNRLTGLYHGWKLSVSETRLAMDDIIATSKRAAITAGDLADAHIRIAATARDIGLEFGDVNQLIISFAESMRLTGREASTTLNTLLQRLQRPRTVAILRRAGIESEELGGGMRPAMDILRDLAKEWKNIGTWLRRDILEAAAGLRRGRQMRAMMASLPEIIDRLGVSIDSTGETARDAARAMDTFTESMKRTGERSAGFWEQYWKEFKKFYPQLFPKAAVPVKTDVLSRIRGELEAGTYIEQKTLERAEMKEWIIKQRAAGETRPEMAEAFQADIERMKLGKGPESAKLVQQLYDNYNAALLAYNKDITLIMRRKSREEAEALAEKYEWAGKALAPWGPHVPGYAEIEAGAQISTKRMEEFFAGAPFRGFQLPEELQHMAAPGGLQDVLGIQKQAIQQRFAQPMAEARTPEQRYEIEKKMLDLQFIAIQDLRHSTAEQLSQLDKVAIERAKELAILDKNLAKAEKIKGNEEKIQEIEEDRKAILEDIGLREEKRKRLFDDLAKAKLAGNKIIIEQLQTELKLLDDQARARADITNAMQSAIDQGLRGILLGGQRTGVEFGKTIGSAIGDQAMKSMMDAMMGQEWWKDILKGLSGQAGGWGKTPVTKGMSGWQAALGYVGAGMMGFQQTQAAGKEGWGGAAGAVGGYAIGGPVGGMLGGYLGSLFDKDADVQQEQLEVAIAYYDASLQELKLSNRHLATMAAAEEYGLPGSYFYRQRAGTGVQVQNLLFTARDGITQIMYADLVATARGVMVM